MAKKAKKAAKKKTKKAAKKSSCGCCCSQEIGTFMDVRKNKEEKKKGFFAKLMEKLDQKLEAKAKKTGCGCNAKNDASNGDSCCG